MNIILKKEKNNFSYIKYFLFTYLKKYSIYEDYIKNDIFFIPYKKRLNIRYFDAISEFLKIKNVEKFLTFDEDIKKELKKHFSAINGKNIYNTIFCDILDYLSQGNIHEYEIIFISDNLKEIKEKIDKCVKNVKKISVLTQKEDLYESMKDYTFSKYGVVLNIKTKKEKLKKHNKIYVNCGYSQVFDKNLFKSVNMIDIYNVYEGAINTIILESSAKEKEYTNALNCPYSLGLAEFLYDEEKNKKYKIVGVKK